MSNPRGLKGKLKRISRPLRHSIFLMVLTLFKVSLKLLPLSGKRWLGSVFGQCLSHLLPTQRHRVMQQMMMTQQFLGLSKVECRRQATKFWRDLGRRAFEYLGGEEGLSLFWCHPETRQTLSEAYENSQQGHGLVVLSAHYGNWELMAAWLSREGFPFMAIASGGSQGGLSAFIRRHRTSMGVRVIHPRGGARRALSYLQRKGVVALLIDQSTSERSGQISFLGHTAPLSLTADRLIKYTHTEALWVTNKMDEEGRYEVIAHRISRGAKEAHEHLERLLIADPSQWVWFHQRWQDRSHHQ